MRTTPLISPPSCTSSRFATTSPCTTLVDWISMRSSARMLPRTSPPIMASREITSPSTSPPFPTSTCRPARTVPTTVPSIFTTPSAVISPTTRIPVPMMDSPASESSGPCPFSVNIAISVLLFHDREGIERFTLAADFEVEVRRRGSSGVAGKSDHLPCLNRVAFAHQQARRVSIHGFIPARVSQEHEQAVCLVGASRLDRTAAGGADGRSGGYGDVDTRMRLGGIAGQLLVVRLGAVQRRGELLHAAVLLLEPRHLALQPGDAGRRTADRSGEREEQHDQQPDDERPPLPRLERPHRHAVLSRGEVSIGVDDDGDATIFTLRHPSNGPPRMSSRSRARSSLE